MPHIPIRAVDEIHIARPPEAVYSVVRDVGGYGRWWPWTVRVRVVTGTGGAGTEVRMRPLGGPAIQFRVEELDPPHRIRMRYHTGPVQGWAEWMVQPEGEGSRVAYRLEAEGKGRLMRAAARVVRLAAFHSWQMRDVLRRLRREVENR